MRTSLFTTLHSAFSQFQFFHVSTATYNLFRFNQSRVSPCCKRVSRKGLTQPASFATSVLTKSSTFHPPSGVLTTPAVARILSTEEGGKKGRHMRTRFPYGKIRQSSHSPQSLQHHILLNDSTILGIFHLIEPIPNVLLLVLESLLYELHTLLLPRRR